MLTKLYEVPRVTHRDPSMPGLPITAMIASRQGGSHVRESRSVWHIRNQTVLKGRCDGTELGRYWTRFSSLARERSACTSGKAPVITDHYIIGLRNTNIVVTGLVECRGISYGRRSYFSNGRPRCIALGNHQDMDARFCRLYITNGNISHLPISCFQEKSVDRCRRGCRVAYAGLGQSQRSRMYREYCFGLSRWCSRKRNRSGLLNEKITKRTGMVFAHTRPRSDLVCYRYFLDVAPLETGLGGTGFGAESPTMPPRLVVGRLGAADGAIGGFTISFLIESVQPR
ncbi:hypothetical protein KOXY103107_01645 [Komagataeibacter xylinus]